MTITTGTSHLGALRAPWPADAAPATALAAVEEERAAVAAALHDDLLQLMIAARYAADLAQRTGPDGLDDLRATLSDAIGAAREVVWSLQPRLRAGLPAALEALADRWADRGVAVRIAGRGLATVLPEVGATLCFRLAQEAAEHAVRRLGATRIDIEVVRRAGTLRLRVAHDGVTDPGAAVAEPPLDRWVRRIELAGGQVAGRGGADWLVAELPVGEGPGDEGLAGP